MDHKTLDAFRLENHVAIITGADDGIGRGITELFAQAEAAVVVSDRNEKTAVEVAQGIKDNGGKAAAVSHLTKNIAFDLGPKGIRVNAIAPRAIKTAALESVLPPEIENAMLKHTPPRRLGEVYDIAYAALYLISPAASWVSGQVLTVSGGGVQELE